MGLMYRFFALVVVSGMFMFGKVMAQATIPAQLLCAQTLINGDVQLTWGTSAEGCGPFTEYQIYVSSTGLPGSFSLLGTEPLFATTSYTHVGADGALNTWYYYIVAIYDCPGFTQTSSDTLDNIDPVAAELDYVTVVGGLSEIHWIPSVSPETNSYIIYRDNGGFTPVATVYGRFTTTYTDVTGVPTAGIETYTIAARDSCGTIGPFNNDAHHTIFLEVQQVDCSADLQLSWNAYDTWTAGVDEYQIWVDRNFAGAVLVDDVDAATTGYTLTGINDGDHVCITIQALRADGTAISVSNEVCLDLNIVQPAAYTVIRNATVSSPTQISIEWYPDNAADLEKKSIRRSLDNITYNNLGTTPVDIPIPVVDAYNDNSMATVSVSFYYQIITIDSCGIEMPSGIVKTILLKGNDNANFTNNINWNAFEITNGIINNYRIYRDDGAGFNMIATVPSATLTYLDDVSAFVNLVDQFCYRIECEYRLNAPENGVDEILFSNSNILCLEQGPRIYVPNAIVPGGVNSVFKPVIIYGMEEGYSMQIFNRYGEIIFETQDISGGWDGTFNGSIVPVGTYGYVIVFTANNGSVITKKGNVTVIR